MPVSLERSPRSQRGLGLVDFAIAIVLLGLLATFAVPRYLTAVERDRVGAAFDYLVAVSLAQEHYQARHDTYSRSLSELHLGIPAPEWYSVGAIRLPMGERDFTGGWELELVRNGHSGGYGKYTVVFNQAGYDPTRSSIPPELRPAGFP